MFLVGKKTYPTLGKGKALAEYFGKTFTVKKGKKNLLNCNSKS